MSKIVRMAMRNAKQDLLWGITELARAAHGKLTSLIGAANHPAAVIPDVVMFKGNRAPVLMFSTRTAREWLSRYKLWKQSSERARREAHAVSDTLYENQQVEIC